MWSAAPGLTVRGISWTDQCLRWISVSFRRLNLPFRWIMMDSFMGPVVVPWVAGPDVLPLEGYRRQDIAPSR